MMAQYKVKEESREIVKEAIAEFLKEIKENEPGTILYEAFEIDESPSDFVHFMTFEDKESEETHKNSDHVKKFVEILYPCCEKEPVFVEMNQVEF